MSFFLHVLWKSYMWKIIGLKSFIFILEDFFYGKEYENEVYISAFLGNVNHVLDVISIHIEKYSINWIRNCLHSCRVFRCSISIDRNILCKTSKSWLYQWMFRDLMCGSKMCISDMLDFFDRLYYRYLNVILDEFCSIFCFAVSNRNDVFSSNADPSWLSFLRSPDEWWNLGENHPTRKNCTKCKIRGFW